MRSECEQTAQGHGPRFSIEKCCARAAGNAAVKPPRRAGTP